MSSKTVETKVVARGYYDVVGLDQGGIACPEPTLAVQASKEESDINNIINRYLRTGELPQVRQGIYADLANMPLDLGMAYEQIAKAEDAFFALPAQIRREFDNDPVKLVEFAQNPENFDRMIELGLLAKEDSPGQPSSAPPAGQAGKAGTEPAAPPQGA